MNKSLFWNEYLNSAEIQTPAKIFMNLMFPLGLREKAVDTLCILFSILKDLITEFYMNPCLVISNYILQMFRAKAHDLVNRSEMP